MSTTDVGGGAERVALDLHHAFRAQAQDATLVVGFKRSDEPGILELPRTFSGSAWTRTLNSLAPGVEAAQHSRMSLLVRRGIMALGSPARALHRLQGLDDFDFPGTATLGTPDLTGRDPDILQLHNLHGNYFDLRQLPELSRKLPTVATLHDAWLSTGHCAQGLNCEKWRTGCGNCPRLDLPPAARRDCTHQNWEHKKALLEQSNLHLVVPSRWMAQRIKGSIIELAQRSLTVIPNGIDLEIFTPTDQNGTGALRRARGLADDAFVVATSAVGAHNPYKDADLTYHACRRLAHAWGSKRSLALLLIGSDANHYDETENLHIVETGYLADRKAVADALRCADVFVHAAHAEAFGLAPVEAQACGIPVIVSDVGGLPETVMPGKTGFLIPEGDVLAAAAHLARLVYAAPPACCV